MLRGMLRRAAKPCYGTMTARKLAGDKQYINNYLCYVCVYTSVELDCKKIGTCGKLKRKFNSYKICFRVVF